MLTNPKIKKLLTGSAVPLLFLIISAIAVPLSKLSSTYLISEVVTRVTRNSFLVLSLLLPVMAGMGINFGMVMGAMAGQIGLVFITSWGIGGVPGLLIAAAIGTPISILLGYVGGLILNRAKGREMITSMMLGFFMSGIYLFFMLFLCGTIVPINNPTVLLSRGYGVRSTLALPIDGALNKLLILTVGSIRIPLVTAAVIVVLCLFMVWFRRTKMGQDMRAIGQDMSVAAASGIAVERTRILSIIISTILACYGQLIFLQDIGTLNTLNGSDQAALFAAAALLIGGATVNKATIANALFGTGLFHLMFVVMPVAGKNLTGQAQLGQYLQQFVSYGVVTIALIIHAWKRHKDREIERTAMRQADIAEKT